VEHVFVRRRHTSIKSWLDVTWDEIREAEKHGEKFMEFELTDIFESASIYGRALDNLVENNIKYVLEREGLLPKGYDVVIPATALTWSCNNGSCIYTAHFAVYDETGNNIVARGVAYGLMHIYDDNTAELMDMTVEMPTDHVKKLKSLAERLKSLARQPALEVRKHGKLRRDNQEADG